MKFDFDTKGDWVAAIYNFDGKSGDYCLCIKSTIGSEEIWMYPSGEVSIQTDGIKFSGEPFKKFYPGDKLTITF